MNTRRHVGVRVPGGVVLLLCSLSSCSNGRLSKEAKTPSLEATLSAGSLVDAAWLTYRNARGASPTEGGIPPECWAKPLKALHPLTVYTHRVNVVVVQRIHDGIEEGKYIYIPISSYLPHSGDDGFEFSPDKDTLGKGVYDFKRTVGKQ